MSYLKNADVPGTATLELLEIASPRLQTVAVAGGDGGGQHDHIHGGVLFHPGYHTEWLIKTYWGDSPIYPNGSESNTDFAGAEIDGYRLPIIWGSSSDQ